MSNTERMESIAYGISIIFVMPHMLLGLQIWIQDSFLVINEHIWIAVIGALLVQCLIWVGYLFDSDN